MSTSAPSPGGRRRRARSARRDDPGGDSCVGLGLDELLEAIRSDPGPPPRPGWRPARPSDGCSTRERRAGSGWRSSAAASTRSRRSAVSPPAGRALSHRSHGRGVGARSGLRHSPYCLAGPREVHADGAGERLASLLRALGASRLPGVPTPSAALAEARPATPRRPPAKASAGRMPLRGTASVPRVSRARKGPKSPRMEAPPSREKRGVSAARLD